DDKVHRFRAFAFLVGFDVEADALTFVQSLEARLFDRGNVHEHVASAVVRLDEAVTPLRIEELHNPSLRHRETPLPAHCSAAGPTHGGSAGHSQSGKA